MAQQSILRASGSNASGTRRFRRRRLYWLPIGVLACANAAFAVALSRFVPAWLASALVGVCYVATVLRFVAQMRDRPRPRAVTLFVDLPLFAHFGASLLAALLSPLCLLVAFALALAHGGLFESWRAALCAAYALGLALSVWSIWFERRFVQVRRFEVKIANLPAEFAGYVIAQLSDLHVGSFDPKRRALQWAALSNSLNPDLAVVTGDLVTSGTGFYTDVADAIATLHAKRRRVRVHGQPRPSPQRRIEPSNRGARPARAAQLFTRRAARQRRARARRP